MRLIEQIGAYAGLATIPGLAILSALYFSQARDVRRLREWAGRAPERSAEQAAGGRVAAQPQQAAKPAAATPAAKPATFGAAKPATVGAAKTAHAGKAAVTPAGVAAAAAKAAQSGHGAPAPATGSAGGVATKEAAVATGAGRATTSAGGGGGSATGTVTRPAVGGARPGGPKTNGPGSGRPAGAGAPAVRRPIPQLTGAQKTSVLGPRQRWYRRAAARLPAARYIALIVVGALVLGGAAAFGISQLTSKDSGSSGNAAGGKQAAQSPAGGGGKQKQTPATPAIAPSSVTVTVVNGTNIANLARDTAAKLSKLGFQIGNTVTGTGPLAAAESVVEYKPGARDKAVFVADKLNINQKQPADADALAQAGPADVIVVLGADQAPGG